MSRKGKALPQATKNHILDVILEAASGIEKKIDVMLNDGEAQCPPKTNPKN